MKQANFAPVFAFMYIGLCDIARENGYALAVHGTLNCDFDLVATPWTDKAIEPFDLVKQIEERIGICEPDIFLGLHSQEPELKPHGRLAWLIKLGNGAALDISVMPKLQSQQAKIDLLEVQLKGAEERAKLILDHKNKMADELQKENDRLNTWYKNVKLQLENKQIDCDRSDRKIDELQARFDEITNHVGINFDEERDDDQHSYWSGYNQAMRELNDILKGNKDE